MTKGGCVEVARMTDEQLLARAGEESAAFEEFYRRHVGKVVGFAVRRCSRPGEVPDLVAAVWLEVIESAHLFNPARGRAVSWLLGVAANLMASEARRSRREREAKARLAGRRVLDDDDYTRLEEEIDAAGLSSNLRNAISMLPEGERAVVELVVLDDLTPGQAAKALGILSSTARMRLARGRTKLRRSLPSFALSVPAKSPSLVKEASP
jgi:RNA polymerase sigma-70 factor (ECF subfamily)